MRPWRAPIFANALRERATKADTTLSRPAPPRSR